MKLRWFSTFTVIGVILVVLGVIGLIDPKFVYDPGQIATPHDALFYLIVGALMILNGVVTPVPTTEEVEREARREARRRRAAVAAQTDQAPDQTT